MPDPVLQLLTAFRPRKRETVDVTAPAPTQEQASKVDPQELIDIVLGSETTPPKGMYLDPELNDPAKREARLRSLTVNPKFPKIAQAWEGVKKRFPYAAATVDRVIVLPSIADRYIAGAAPSLPFDTEYLGVAPSMERESPETITDTLLHELAHVSQFQNFPSFMSRRASIRADKPYMERPHEAQAYDVEFANREMENRRRMIANTLRK